MQENSNINIGGNIEDAIKGHYAIDVQAVLKEAWQNTQQSRMAINNGLILVFVLGIISSYFVSSFFGGIEQAIKNPQVLMSVQVLVSLIIWPFLAGVEMMGVFHAVGVQTKTTLIFAFLRRASWIVLASLLTSVLVNLGLKLFVLPGVFLAVVFSLIIPLVLEKKLSPLKAMVISLQAIRFQWFKLFALYAFLILLIVLAFMPFYLLKNGSYFILGMVIFFFALSYIAPLFYNVKGILYREIFGLTVQTTQNNTSMPDDVFLA